MRIRTALALACVLIGAACSTPERACTMIAALAGVSVTVDATVADETDDLRLTVCHGQTCTDVAVALFPGSRTVPASCPPSKDPDTACSASAVPDGTKVGYAHIDGLPEGAITVAGSLRRGGRTVTLAKTTASAVLVYPNGRDCPGEASQARVRIDAAGLHAA